MPLLYPLVLAAAERAGIDHIGRSRSRLCVLVCLLEHFEVALRGIRQSALR